MNRAVAASLFAVLALASCAGLQSRAERELQVPPVEVRVEHRAGALLGPIAAAGGADTLKADDALAVEARAVWLESAPSGGVPLASRAKLVSAERGGEAIEARSRLAGGARLLRGVEAQAALARPGRTREISREELALPAGVTATLALLEERTVRGEDGDLLRRELRAEIGRSARGELAVALILEDLLAEDLELDEDAAEDPQFATRRECLLLDDAPEVGEAPLVIFVPQEEPYAGLVLGIVLRASGPAALSSVTRALEQARAAERRRRARSRSRPPSAPSRTPSAAARHCCSWRRSRAPSCARMSRSTPTKPCSPTAHAPSPRRCRTRHASRPTAARSAGL
jgi:hypothetical protein